MALINFSTPKAHQIDQILLQKKKERPNLVQFEWILFKNDNQKQNEVSAEWKKY